MTAVAWLCEAGYSAHSPVHTLGAEQQSRPYSNGFDDPLAAAAAAAGAPHHLNVSYRVRQGPCSKCDAAGTGNSLQSSGGWVMPLPEEEAEEALKRELRKAKVCLAVHLLRVCECDHSQVLLFNFHLCSYVHVNVLYLSQKKMKRQQQIEEWQREKEQRMEAQMKAEVSDGSTATIHRNGPF